MSDLSALAIVDHLLAHQIPLVVIGGHAVNVHGFARATEDVDIVFLRTSESESRLADALSEVNSYWIGNEIDPATGIEKIHSVTADYIRKSRLMMLGTDLGFLDLFDFIPSLPDEPTDNFFATAIERNGRPFASLGWIRRMKSAANRPIDRIDLENLPADRDG
ncbi:hypothetical protein LF1_28910 [Rubripirellula obstinata]|uniref:Nucleotidyltransferase family protein n=1 Tax=Rubripirellula obstinata TaxID=406547 RepID=A0A5B1CJA7_9BACT|nr:hypothetical protein [Rubripirellula obstinata]KAA1260351.1 hypothetical protein LF1_28910 [Rubripirellula obstinata]